MVGLNVSQLYTRWVLHTLRMCGQTFELGGIDLSIAIFWGVVSFPIYQTPKEVEHPEEDPAVWSPYAQMR